MAKFIEVETCGQRCLIPTRIVIAVWDSGDGVLLANRVDKKGNVIYEHKAFGTFDEVKSILNEVEK